jgi:3',5'-cyclic-nucleotide phosphodiesterase
VSRFARYSTHYLTHRPGSGLGALTRILHDQPHLFLTNNGVRNGPAEWIGKTRTYSAAVIYSFVTCVFSVLGIVHTLFTIMNSAFLITHAHLDHIMGLVMLAGGINGVRKSIRASRQTLEDLETIFRPSRIWPNLASWNREDSDFLYLYDP